MSTDSTAGWPTAYSPPLDTQTEWPMKPPGEKPAKVPPKKRGRPRMAVDKDGAEKRRVQVRLAQRAYRDRKENTMAQLRERVAKLESGIEELSKSFLSFSELLLTDGVLKSHPAAARELKHITRLCVSLASSGSQDSERTDEVDEEVQEVHEEVQEAHDLHNLHEEPTIVSSDSQESSPNEVSPGSTEIMRLPAEGLPLNILPSMYAMNLSRKPRPVFQFSDSWIDLVMAKQTFCGLSILPVYLEDKKDYWSQLSYFPFARRLLYMCTKYGYELLTEPVLRMDAVARLVPPGFTEQERQRVTTLFKDVLGLEPCLVIEAQVERYYAQNLPEKADAEIRLRQFMQTRELLVQPDHADSMLDVYAVDKFLRAKDMYVDERTYTVPLPETAGVSFPPHVGIGLLPLSLQQPVFYVQTFIQMLAHVGTCIDEAPAFRRLDVELAYEFAISRNTGSLL